MKFLYLYLFLASSFAFGQNYYDQENTIEKLMKDKKFVEANEKAALFITEKKQESDDELNYYQFLKNMSHAQINIWEKGDAVAALKDCETAEIFIKATKNVSPVRRSDFYQYYATLLTYVGKKEQANSFYLYNIDFLSKVNQSKDNEIELADNFVRYSTVLFNDNNKEESLNYMLKAEKIYEKHKYDDAGKVGTLHHGLGVVYEQKGYSDKAFYHFGKSLAFLETKTDLDNIRRLIRAYEVFISNNINYGKLEEAKMYLGKVRAAFEKNNKLINEDPLIALDLNLRYSVMNLNYLTTIKDKEAIKKNITQLKSQVDLNNLKKYSNENVYMVSAAYSYLSGYYKNTNQVKKAIETNNFMLEKLSNVKYKNCKLIFNANLGYLYSDLGKNDVALKYINLAIEDATKIKFTLLSAYKTLRSELLLKQNINIDPTQNTIVILEGMLSKKLSVAEFKKLTYKDFNGLNSERDLLILLSLAKTHYAVFTKNKSIKDLEAAFKFNEIASEMFANYYKKGIFNASLSSLSQSINDGLLSTGYDLKIKDPRNVLVKVEQNTSRYLWNEFILKNPSVDFGQANKWIKKLQQINANKNKAIAEREKQITLGSRSLDEFTSLIVGYEQQEDAITDSINNSNKKYNSFSNPSFDLAKIQSQLSDNEVILRYVVTLSKVFLFEIDARKCSFFFIGNKTDVEVKVKKFRAEISNNSAEFKNLSVKLYQLLLPNKPKDNFKLTIVADDFLNYIPFESLQKSPNAFLLSSHLISYSNSLIFLQNQLKSDLKSDKKLIAFAPIYNQKSVQSDIAYLQRSGLYELKGAQEEAKTIAKSFSGVLISGNDASKKQFIDKANQFQIVHLSMHSILDEKQPENSSLVFSGNEKLYFSELYGMKIPAEMAVLSACNTGSGSIKNGEGIMSMSRAFTFSGVKSSVYSLWQVPDKETSEIMISFYENLKKGQAKDEALANAKKIFIANNPMKNHPFYWAGFVVNGDVSPIMSGSNWLMYLGIGVGILIMVVVFRKKLFEFRN